MDGITLVPWFEGVGEKREREQEHETVKDTR